jgi:hypothetical protein
MTLGGLDGEDGDMTSRGILKPAWGCALLAVLFATFTACSSDENSDTSATDAAETYCASVADIEEYAGGLFAALGGDASVEDELAAERQVSDYMQEQGYDTQELPAEIAEDWQLFWNGWTTRLEPGNPQPTTEQLAAEERVLAWEVENCSS